MSELLKVKPELKSFRQQPTQFGGEEGGDDDNKEHYEDADEAAIDEEAEQDGGKAVDDEEVVASEDEQGSAAATPADEIEVTAPSTWIHRNNAQTRSGQKGYDPLARNPMYARAEESGGFWEILVLAEHNHPSVSLIIRRQPPQLYVCVYRLVSSSRN